MTVSGNPYLNRAAIKDVRHFIGRRNELDILVSRITADEPQSVSVIGDRKLGKSSLLRALLHQKDAHLKRPDEYIFTYSDLQEMMHGDASAFFLVLMEQIALEKHDPGIAEQAPTYENFRKLITNLNQSRVKVILLLDEFDAVTQNDRFGIEFFSFLRSLPNNYALSFVVTSAHELQQFCHSREIAGSPFFNIFHKLNLGCFSHREAMQLITGPSREAGRPLESYAGFIINLAGHFPFFLQLACCAVFEFLEQHPGKEEPDWSLIRKQFQEEAQDHFEYIWDHFSHRERTVCLKTIQGRELDSADHIWLAGLKRRGYIFEDKNGLSFFSDVFRSFLEEPEARHKLYSTNDDINFDGPMTSMPVTRQSADGTLVGIRIGRFSIRKLLGCGAMGEVYLAQDTVLKRHVALKRISSVYRNDEFYRQRFIKEAERASQLSDPHIAGVYDLLEERGELFLVMEFVDGRTLRHRFKDPLSIREFLNIAGQCAGALAAAHSRGIIHCDIKPENILLSSSDHVKILDFGVAKYLPKTIDLTDTATTVMYSEGIGGTPGYMSPELLLEQRADERSDIFSLGVVFYEALGRRHPFRESTWANTVDRIIHLVPASLKELNADVFEDIDHIVTTCLEKDPERRFQSASELGNELLRIQLTSD
jgi:tRNA A-37 threonylcarbamoyl transferase component Bud32